MTDIDTFVPPVAAVAAPTTATIKIPLLPRKRGKPTATKTDDATEPIREIGVIPLKTFHFNPSPQMVDFLTEFACVHKYDDRKTFKEAWMKTIAEPDVAPLIDEEIAALENAGYEGKALDKIFVSLKYYYVKKAKKTGQHTDNSGNGETKKPRKKYECLECDHLTQIDEHIASLIQTHIAPNLNPHTNKDSAFVKICVLSPSAAYDNYMEKYCDVDWDETKIAQVKKTFKNRFFRMKKMLSQ